MRKISEELFRLFVVFWGSIWMFWFFPMPIEKFCEACYWNSDKNLIKYVENFWHCRHFTILICQSRSMTNFLCFIFQCLTLFCRSPPLPRLNLLINILLFYWSYYEWDIFLLSVFWFLHSQTSLEMFARFKWFLAKSRGTFNIKLCLLQIRTVCLFPITFLLISLCVLAKTWS